MEILNLSKDHKEVLLFFIRKYLPICPAFQVFLKTKIN